MIRPLPLWLAAWAALHAVLGGAAEFTDQRGLRHELDAPAQRVVYIPPAVRGYLTVDNGDDHLVGSSAFATRMVRQGLLGTLYPKAGGVTDVTRNGWFEPNVEAVLAARPEAVFQTVQLGPEVYQPLERAGLRVVGISGVKGEQDFLSWARLAGAVTGRQARAEELIGRFEHQGRELQEVLDELPETERPRVLHLMSVEPLRPMVGGTAFDQAIRRAGGRNVAGALRKFGPVAFEQLLLWDPEVILISGWPEEQHRPADLFGDPHWAVLKAVKNRRVYKVPMGGQRFEGLVEGPLHWRWLAELLHPERLDGQFRDRFRETYQAVYDYPLSDPEIDRAIHLEANRASRGFERFVATKQGLDM